MDTFGTPLQYVMSIVYVRSFVEPDLFDNNVPLDNTVRIRVRLRVALFEHF